METPRDRYARLRESFAAKVAAVPEDAWDNPSPCEQWTARDVVAHVIETQGMFEGLVGRTLDEGPAVGDDPVGAFTTATDQVQAHLDDPATAAAEFDGTFGRSTFAEAVGAFLAFDFVVHGWDLARATGQDEQIAPHDLAWVREQAAGLGESLRTDGVCGPEVAVPADAGDQDKLLALLGRRP